MRAVSVEMKRDTYSTYTTKSPKMLSPRDDVNEIVTGNIVEQSQPCIVFLVRKI